jgi:hypothetical protein
LDAAAIKVIQLDGVVQVDEKSLLRDLCLQLLALNPDEAAIAVDSG